MTTNHPITGLITREGFYNTTPTTSLLLQTNTHGGQAASIASRDHHCLATVSDSDSYHPRYQTPWLFGQEEFTLGRTDYAGVASHHSREPAQGYCGNCSESYSDPSSQFEQRLSTEATCTSAHTNLDFIQQQCRELSNNSLSNYQSSEYRTRHQNMERQLIEENQEPTDVNSFAAPFNAVNPSLTPAADINPPTTPLDFLTPVEETQPGLEHSELVCGQFSLRLPHSVVLYNN